VAKPAPNQRIEDILRRLTLEEKIGLCHGSFEAGGVPRLGIGQIKMMDGVRAFGPSTKPPTLLRSPVRFRSRVRGTPRLPLSSAGCSRAL
jgi:hypothetical protein